MKRATYHCVYNNKAYIISIHALCEEGDDYVDARLAGITLFQSTPSVKRATEVVVNRVADEQFQSTPSVKRATFGLGTSKGGKIISIHALCEEGDPAVNAVKGKAQEFQSTPSVKRATGVILLSGTGTRISIHALCEEGDRRT